MVRPERVRQVGSGDAVGTGPVVYAMNRDCRLHDNWAYLYARMRAEEAKRPLVVVYNLAPGFLGGGLRAHLFKLAGLREVEAHAKVLSTPFFIVPADGVASFVEEYDAHSLVTDFSPLRLQQTWLKDTAMRVRCPVYEVDAHNIIPAWVVSEKLEFAARTIRPKIHRHIASYLEEFPGLRAHAIPFTGTVPEIDWSTREKGPDAGLGVAPASWVVPGYAAGMKALSTFVTERLHRYGEARNDPNMHGQSGLSPYFHYGHISPQRAALEALKDVAHKHESPGDVAARVMDARKNGSGEKGNSIAAFLEELIVRRELSDNFCLYNPHYDSVEGFASWATTTLNAHRADERAYVYTYEEFEGARTHDDLWNAAQRELIRTGKMHGYLRMYWAKKILEWTATPEDAMAITIRLNDTYELDGRDPNGYAGIAWSIGGVHDRPWFTRPIFGTVRYMARSGCEKKFDVPEYIARFS